MYILKYFKILLVILFFTTIIGCSNEEIVTDSILINEELNTMENSIEEANFIDSNEKIKEKVNEKVIIDDGTTSINPDFKNVVVEDTNKVKEPIETVELTENVETSDNLVYGRLIESDMIKISEGYFKEKERQFVRYIEADGIVFQVEVHLDSNMKINIKQDLSFLTEHVFDHMEDDSTLIQTKSNIEFVYESKKIGKKYDVMFVSDTGNEYITRVIVGQH
jgi:hypothetical protein